MPETIYIAADAIVPGDTFIYGPRTIKADMVGRAARNRNVVNVWGATETGARVCLSLWAHREAVKAVSLAR